MGGGLSCCETDQNNQETFVQEAAGAIDLVEITPTDSPLSSEESPARLNGRWRTPGKKKLRGTFSGATAISVTLDLPDGSHELVTIRGNTLMRPAHDAYEAMNGIVSVEGGVLQITWADGSAWTPCTKEEMPV
mmetsp:Transcript_21712/g.64666  ORF Transcript_21712/g.64666 Transcript_21712/m.64666 type:complete len:133 (+) Transcript_21712:152-550(+)